MAPAQRFQALRDAAAVTSRCSMAGGLRFEANTCAATAHLGRRRCRQRDDDRIDGGVLEQLLEAVIAESGACAAPADLRPSSDLSGSQQQQHINACHACSRIMHCSTLL